MTKLFISEIVAYNDTEEGNTLFNIIVPKPAVTSMIKADKTQLSVSLFYRSLECFQQQ